MALKNLMRRGPVLLLALLALSLALPSTSTAGPTLIVEFTGLNLVYNVPPATPGSGDLCDATSCLGGGGDPANADPLASMTATINGSAFGPTGTDIWASVDLALPTTLTPGGTVSGTGGTFNLLTQNAVPGWGVQLSVNSWEVTLTSNLQRFFGGGEATVIAQDLPIPGIGFDVTQPVRWSFSSQLDSGDGTGFESSGTGEIRGPYVPEPGTLFLLGGVLSGLALLRRRRR